MENYCGGCELKALLSHQSDEVRIIFEYRMSSSDSKLVLYAKAGPDSVSLGDCPFSHKTHMAFKLAGFPYELKLIDLSNKPDEFLKDINPNGSVPCCQNMSTGSVIVDSDEIIRTYCNLSLDVPDNLASAINPIFGAFAGLMKNKDEEKENQYKNELRMRLAALNSFLQDNSSSPYLGGASLGYADCKIAPQLYHIKVC